VHSLAAKRPSMSGFNRKLDRHLRDVGELINANFAEINFAKINANFSFLPRTWSVSRTAWFG